MSNVPDVLTVEEAAVALWIGRTAAYQLARRYLATDGADGIPARRVGRQLRIPKDLLEAWLGTTLHAPTLKAEQSAPPSRPPHQSNRPDTQLKLITND